MLILGIETSCDETAASVVKNGRDILSNVISSSLHKHAQFGGVIPEIATRHHVENLDKVIKGSLHNARLKIEDMEGVAVTRGPGLVASLLTGIACAKAISFSLDIPLVAVDHLRAHIYSAMMGKDSPEFPFIGLVISGGHTRLYLVKDYDNFRILGDTLDDAVGEAYDKVAKILGLGYPGGPVIDKIARQGDPKAVRFTCKSVNSSLDFSFSGIKTAVLYHYTRDEGRGTRDEDIAASFQEAVLNVIVENSIKAMEKYKIKALVIGGGVSANSRLREMMDREARYRNFKLYFPAPGLCSDNASMVAGLAYRLYRKGIMAPLDLTAKN